MGRARVAKVAAVGFVAMFVAVITGGAASAESSMTARPTEPSKTAAPAACAGGTVPFQTNEAVVPLYRHVGDPIPGGRMERTGEYFGGNFCALWSFTNPQGVEFLSRATNPGWIRASDAHRR